MSDVDTNLNAFDTEFSSILESSEDNILPAKERSKRGRKKKLTKSQLAEASVLQSTSSNSKSRHSKTKLGRDDHSDAGAFDTDLYSSILESPSKEDSKRKNKLLDKNILPEKPIFCAQLSHRFNGKRRSIDSKLAKDCSLNDAESFLNASESLKDIPAVEQKSKRGRKKKLPTVNQFPETSLFDSSSSQLSSTKIKKELEVGKKSKEHFTKILPVSASEIYNNCSASDAIRSTKKYTARKCITIKDIIDSSKNNVVNLENSSNIKNNYSQSKSFKDWSKNDVESRSNISTKMLVNSECDLKGSSKIKKKIGSPHVITHHNSSDFSDSSEIDDFFATSDSAWPAQDAGTLNDDIKTKVSEKSSTLNKQKLNSAQATNFLKTDDSSENLRNMSKYNDHDIQSPRKSFRIKKRNARYSSDTFFSPDDENTKLHLLNSPKKKINIEPNLKKDNENLNSSSVSQNSNSVSLSTQAVTVATTNGSGFPNQNPFLNNVSLNGCKGYAVPAYIIPSSNTLVISLPPSFNSNQVNASNQNDFRIQVPSYNSFNMTQLNSPATHQDISNTLFHGGHPLSQPSNINGQNLQSSNITIQAGFQKPPDTMVVNSSTNNCNVAQSTLVINPSRNPSQDVSYPLFQGTPLSQTSNIQGQNLSSSNIADQTRFQKPDTMVVNSSTSNCNVNQSTPVIDVQNMRNYNSPKQNSKAPKRMVTVNRIFATEKTFSQSVNSRQKRNSASTVSEAHRNRPSKYAAVHNDLNKKEQCLVNNQLDSAVVKDIVNGLVLWDSVMFNLTGFCCMQRMTEFTVSVFSACDFNEFVTVQEYFSNSDTITLLNTKVIEQNFEIPCQVKYLFPEPLFDTKMRSVLKSYVTYHLKHLLNVTNHKELIEEVYQKFSLKDCFYLSIVVPKKAKTELSLKILAEYFTFVAVLRIYDEYKKRMELL